MTLTSRITLKEDETAGEPEDFFSSAIGVVFSDDFVNQHGDSEHSLVYTSPHLPRPLTLDLAHPTAESDRELFSHYLWNAGLLVAELLETDCLGINSGAASNGGAASRFRDDASFDIRNRSLLEVGAGTGLPSIMAALCGAARVTAADYPTEPVLKALRDNVARNTTAQHAPDPSKVTPPSAVAVEGHEWGKFTDEFAQRDAHTYDRVIASDCLWMSWQHNNLRQTIAHFLGLDADARAWVIAQFHTGREKAAEFFDKDALREVGLEVDRIWEMDFNGIERAWEWERENEKAERKLWVCVAVLRRITPR